MANGINREYRVQMGPIDDVDPTDLKAVTRYSDRVIQGVYAVMVANGEFEGNLDPSVEDGYAAIVGSQEHLLVSPDLTHATIRAQLDTNLTGVIEQVPGYQGIRLEHNQQVTE